MTVHWNIKEDRLVGRWSNGESTSKYDFDWMKKASAYEGQRPTCIIDMSLLSPFGGARWYAFKLRQGTEPRFPVLALQND